MIANKNIGIIVAMPGEYEGIVKSEEDREILDKPFTMYSRMIGDTKLITLISGVGKVNAACATQFMIENFAPEWIINIGVCGATKDAFEECDTAIISRVVNSDFDTSAIDGDSFEVPEIWLMTGEDNIKDDTAMQMWKDRALDAERKLEIARDALKGALKKILK